MPGIEEMRMELSQAVRNAWESEQGVALRQRLENIAGNKHEENTFAACLAKAAEEGKSYKKAAAECAKKYGISKDYAQAWGKS